MSIVCRSQIKLNFESVFRLTLNLQHLDICFYCFSLNWYHPHWWNWRRVSATVMACLARLKEDTRFLESVFPQEHRVFQIVSASLDEFTCRFVGKNGEKPTLVHANVTVCIVSLLNCYKHNVVCSYEGRLLCLC